MSPSFKPPLIVFCGVQASGKTSFYQERFLTTHVRISRDLLRTRHREDRFLALCLETGMAAVIDNTNPSRTDRASYLARAHANDSAVIGYYFQSKIQDCLMRNAQRAGAARIPDSGLRSCASRLEIPLLDEGFAQLHYVAIQPGGGFHIKEWTDGIR